VETANLDGETNLKIRQALPETARFGAAPALAAALAAAPAARPAVECEPPNSSIYTFVGRLKCGEGGVVAPLGPSQVGAGRMGGRGGRGEEPGLVSFTRRP
jgi:phospholipid-transporting ATPase